MNLNNLSDSNQIVDNGNDLCKTSDVRVRFAPSPTGFGGLHCGGIRTALYNYLFAKKLGGKMILRIEDTDSQRFCETAEQNFQAAFDWLGIEFDESPSKGGAFAPYRQSERKDIYLKYCLDLINSGKAYYAFDSSDELTNARTNIENFSYNFETRKNMKNSLRLPDSEIERLLLETNDWVVRIKYPDVPVTIEVDDIIRGKVVVDSSTLDDKVIWKKKDELPTYHLANIVDDHLMLISHVIRGEEWLPSAPLHVYLYQCFGWNSPLFAHLPLILGPSGAKLSKRDGDKYGFSVYPIGFTNTETGVYVNGYKDDGYTPEAVINMLAFIGWNPGTEKEVYTMDELINDFDLKRINKAGGKFNPVKAAWFNGQHLKTTPTEKLVDSFKAEMNKRGIVKDDNFIFTVIDANKGKVNFIKEIFDVAGYLFTKPTVFDIKTMKKWNNKSVSTLTNFKNEISCISEWTEINIQTVFEKYIADNNMKFGDVMPILRLVLTGLGNGSSLFNIMELLGKDETINRLSDLNSFEIVGTIDIPDIVKTDVITKNIDQLTKDLDVAKTSLKGIESRLSNDSFVSRAPVSVVESERNKIGELKIRIQEIEKEINL